MPTKEITFQGAGGDSLSGRVELPASGRPKAWALFAHCFTCSKNVRAAVDIARSLSTLGVGVLRFDFTGLGESEGDFADTSFSSNVADLVAAAHFMCEELGPPAVMIGHSLGGAAVLQAAGRVPSVKAVVTIGAPADPVHVLKHLASSREEIERDGEATVEIAGRDFQVKQQFVDDLEAQDVETVVSELDRALLIFHSSTDEVVALDDAARLYQMARHPKSFVSLDRADHMLSDPADSRYVALVLAAWASKYVSTQADANDLESLVDPERAVSRTQPGSFYTEIGVREHSLVADEPRAVGGEDLGPTPYDYLLAGLGSCTSMTLQMYADRKKWPLEEARVRLNHRRVHADDCSACVAGEDARLDVIDREVELLGPLDEEQRTRLLEIASRCPVHRTLDAGIRIETTARENPGE